ncbi:S-adenosyl-methyltransferase MraW [Ahrensia sp. R2A130]|nr:S-adenosyl-methyltransferase MraW [Ahrensia sp. R2A130]
MAGSDDRGAGGADVTTRLRLPSTSVLGRSYALSRAGRAQLRAGRDTKRLRLPGAPNMSTPDQPHIPVMLEEVLRALRPLDGSTIVDATFGAGGYSRAMLGGGATVIGIDRDPDAVAAAQPMLAEFDGSLTLHHGRFSQLDKICRSAGHETVDGVVADIGVSSMQIDQAERGFSFLRDGPLDMRMEQSGPSAADVVNLLPRNDLTRVIGILGEERQASRVSAQIVEDRAKRPFETTLQLASLVEKVLSRKAKDKIHPATRTFQALRIFVNGELDQLAQALLAAERVLVPGGRLVVVTFHSLEDRLVKIFLKDRAEQASGSRHMPVVDITTPTFNQIKRGAISASAAEAEINPRARSAKLRWAVRTEEPPRVNSNGDDLSIFGLPRLPDPASISTS